MELPFWSAETSISFERAINKKKNNLKINNNPVKNKK